MAAPSRPETPAVGWNQRLAAGEASSTSGFKVELNSTLDISLPAGRAGKLPRSSRSEREELMASGTGIVSREMVNTARMLDKMPLIIRSVKRYDAQVWRTRGAWLRVATRMMSAARHSTGNTRIRGTNNNRAHTGTGFGTLGRTS